MELNVINHLINCQFPLLVLFLDLPYINQNDLKKKFINPKAVSIEVLRLK